MRVVVLRGNPRKTGYTQRVTDWFVQGLKEAGAFVEDVDLSSVSILPCNGCYHCWLDTPGQCVHGDQMSELQEQLLAAEVMVCATPLYYFSMSAHLKLFFERLLPLSAPGIVPSRAGHSRNRLRFPEKWAGKRMVTIVTGALREPELYRPINETFRLIADTLDMEMSGQLTRPETALLDYRLSKPKTLKRIEVAFIEAGRETVRARAISEKTVQEAGLPLAASTDHFRTYAGYYWEHATSMGPQALDLVALKDRVGGDVRILMREMVRSVDPQAIARVRAVIQFEFPDRAAVFSVHIDHGKCELREEAGADPDLRVTCQSQVWSDLFTRQIRARDALLSRQLILHGNKSLFTRLERFFPVSDD
jgi:putative NADPH-quinone reductase/putative sterol carrier protein